jgi:hypothetical protein
MKLQDHQSSPATTRSRAAAARSMTSNVRPTAHDFNGASGTSSVHVEDLRRRHERLLGTLAHLKRDTWEFGERYMQTLSVTDGGGLSHGGCSADRWGGSAASISQKSSGARTAIVTNHTDAHWHNTQALEGRQGRPCSPSTSTPQHESSAARTLQRRWAPSELGPDAMYGEEPTIIVDNSQHTPIASRAASSQVWTPTRTPQRPQRHSQSSTQVKRRSSPAAEHDTFQIDASADSTVLRATATATATATGGTRDTLAGHGVAPAALVDSDDDAQVEVLRRDIAGLDSEIALLQEKLFTRQI